eukprot:gene6360-8764_t
MAALYLLALLHGEYERGRTRRRPRVSPTAEVFPIWLGYGRPLGSRQHWVTRQTTVLQLKAEVAAVQDFPVTHTALSYGREPLENGHTLGHYGIQKEQTVWVTARMLGGGGSGTPDEHREVQTLVFIQTPAAHAKKVHTPVRQTFQLDPRCTLREFKGLVTQWYKPHGRRLEGPNPVSTPPMDTDDETTPPPPEAAAGPAGKEGKAPGASPEPIPPPGAPLPSPNPVSTPPMDTDDGTAPAPPATAAGAAGKEGRAPEAGPEPIPPPVLPEGAPPKRRALVRRQPLLKMEDYLKAMEDTELAAAPGPTAEVLREQYRSQAGEGATRVCPHGIPPAHHYTCDTEDEDPPTGPEASRYLSTLDRTEPCLAGVPKAENTRYVTTCTLRCDRQGNWRHSPALAIIGKALATPRTPNPPATLTYREVQPGDPQLDNLDAEQGAVSAALGACQKGLRRAVQMEILRSLFAVGIYRRAGELTVGTEEAARAVPPELIREIYQHERMRDAEYRTVTVANPTEVERDLGIEFTKDAAGQRTLCIHTIKEAEPPSLAQASRLEKGYTWTNTGQTAHRTYGEASHHYMQMDKDGPGPSYRQLLFVRTADVKTGGKCPVPRLIVPGQDS